MVLSYDDGPHPGSTPAILRELERRRATATFFVLVGRARRYPSLLQEVADAGHEIALHGPDHVRITSLPPAVVRRRTREAKNDLEQLTGRPVRWFRPPYGKQRALDVLNLRSLGLASVVWGPTFLDWQEASPTERLLSATQDIRAGSVVLAHDAFAGPDVGADDGPEPTVDRAALTASVLSAYADRGLRATSLGGALAREARLERVIWLRR